MKPPTPSDHMDHTDPIEIYTTNQLHVDGKIMEESGIGPISIDGRHGFTAQEVIRVAKLHENRLIHGAQFGAQDEKQGRISMIVPDWADQLPADWLATGQAITICRNTESIEGRIEYMNNGRREDDPPNRLVLILRVDRRKRNRES